MAHFEEKSGVVYCKAPWGQWFQTMEEVCVEVRVEPGTRAKDIKCQITSHSLSVCVSGHIVIKVRGESVVRPVALEYSPSVSAHVPLQGHRKCLSIWHDIPSVFIFWTTRWRLPLVHVYRKSKVLYQCKRKYLSIWHNIPPI